MIIHLSLLFICFIVLSYSQINTIDKVCVLGSSTCGVGQACVNGKCECDPAQRRFWAGDKHHCRVCPADYIRQPTRCYKHYRTAKNHSEARTDCQKSQADLFSWRDNSDENELLTASTTQWNYVFQSLNYQFYAWSGGIVHHGRGSKAEYKITWFDPKGPTIRHPEFNDPLTERYCNNMMMTNYNGIPEPTRQIKNGETENCVSLVFLPQPNSRGHICMADDYCSTKMSYICEFTEASLSGIYETLPTAATTTEDPSEGHSDSIEETTDNSEIQEPGPSALGDNEDSNQSNTLIYVIGGIVILVIIGAVTFIIIRKRKQSNRNMNVSPTNSIASSSASGADIRINLVVIGLDSETEKRNVSYHYECGISTQTNSNYTLGSSKAAVGAWPWVASLRQKISSTEAVHFCGGSIIAPRLVLTAAHCFHNITIPTDPNYARRIGEVHIGQLGLTDQGQRIAEWIKVIIPEKYLPFRPHDYSYDIALLILNKDIVDNQHPVICLPSNTVISNIGDHGTIVGWGIHSEVDTETSEYMMQVTVPILDPTIDACNPLILPPKNYTMTICAGVLTGGIDACQGNSGGPFAQKIKDRWYNIGVVSHGLGCARENSPAFYTRLTAHLNWLCEIAKTENEMLPVCFDALSTSNAHNNSYYSIYLLFSILSVIFN